MHAIGTLMLLQTLQLIPPRTVQLLRLPLPLRDKRNLGPQTLQPASYRHLLCVLHRALTIEIDSLPFQRAMCLRNLLAQKPAALDVTPVVLGEVLLQFVRALRSLNN